MIKAVLNTWEAKQNTQAYTGGVNRKFNNITRQ